MGVTELFDGFWSRVHDELVLSLVGVSTWGLGGAMDGSSDPRDAKDPSVYQILPSELANILGSVPVGKGYILSSFVEGVSSPSTPRP